LINKAKNKNILIYCVTKKVQVMYTSVFNIPI